MTQRWSQIRFNFFPSRVVCIVGSRAVSQSNYISQVIQPEVGHQEAGGVQLFIFRSNFHFPALCFIINIERQRVMQSFKMINNRMGVRWNFLSICCICVALFLSHKLKKHDICLIIQYMFRFDLLYVSQHQFSIRLSLGARQELIPDTAPLLPCGHQHLQPYICQTCQGKPNPITTCICISNFVLAKPNQPNTCKTKPDKPPPKPNPNKKYMKKETKESCNIEKKSNIHLRIYGILKSLHVSEFS